MKYSSVSLGLAAGEQGNNKPGIPRDRNSGFDTDRPGYMSYTSTRSVPVSRFLSPSQHKHEALFLCQDIIGLTSHHNLTEYPLIGKINS